MPLRKQMPSFCWGIRLKPNAQLSWLHSYPHRCVPEPETARLLCVDPHQLPRFHDVASIERHVYPSTHANLLVAIQTERPSTMQQQLGWPGYYGID